MKGDGIPLTPDSGPLLPRKDLCAGTRSVHGAMRSGAGVYIRDSPGWSAIAAVRDEYRPSNPEPAAATPIGPELVAGATGASRGRRAVSLSGRPLPARDRRCAEP